MSCILQHKQVAQRELFPVEMMLAVVCVVLFMILAYLQYRIRRVKKRGKHCIVNLFFGCPAPARSITHWLQCVSITKQTWIYWWELSGNRIHRHLWVLIAQTVPLVMIFPCRALFNSATDNLSSTCDKQRYPTL